GVGVVQATESVTSPVVGWAFTSKPGRARYIPLGHTGLGDTPNLPVSQVLQRLRGVLSDASVKKVGHDLKSLAIALALDGAPLAGDDVDTMLISYLVDATRSEHDLAGLALERLNYKAESREALTGKGVKAVTLDAVPAASLLTYACECADLPL